MTRKTVAITIIALFATNEASALDCPGGYSAFDCEVSTNFGNMDACSYDAPNDRYTCFLNYEEGNPGGMLWAVSGFDTNPREQVSVWGIQPTGEAFCCSHTETMPDPITDMRIKGSAGGDYIYLEYNGDALNDNGFGGGHFKDVDVDGNDGDDVLFGSTTTNAAYDEVLNGGKGSDTIEGDLGADTLYGCGVGAWPACVANDHDTLRGGGGNDDIFCDANSCDAEGNGGADDIVGSDQSDTIHGGLGQDWICGKGAVDILDGGGHNDVIYGGAAVDFITGGGGTDTCKLASESDCELVAPGGCGL